MIHLVTAARGAEDHYTRSNNKVCFQFFTDKVFDLVEIGRQDVKTLLWLSRMICLSERLGLVTLIMS